MSDRTRPPTRPTDAAGIIAYAMQDQGITLNALANLIEIRPDVIQAILEGEIPVPLMLVPKIADALDTDARPLMTQALGEQWFSILEATASAILWEESAIHRELIAFLTEANGGEVPSISEDPALAGRLLRAVRNKGDDGAEDEDDDGGGSPVH
jgi:plasmid maintenance system antidote protein VapI